MLGLLGVLFFIGLNGFFVAAEFALVKLRATYQGAKVEPGDMVGQAVSKIERYLSVTQLGITLASLGLGWIGEPAIADQINRVYERFAHHEPSPPMHTAIEAVSFALLTYGHVLLGELVPKLVAIQKSAAVAGVAAWPLRIFFYALFPGLWLLEGSSRLILGRLGLQLDSHGEAAMSEDEIIGILAAHVARGRGAADKQELVRRMMRFSERTARQAMIPRVDVFYLPVATPGAAALEQLRSQEFSRVPLSKGQEIDHIVGYLYWKDMIRDPRAAEMPNLDRLRRDVLFVPASQALVNVLREMQRTHTPFAVVVDEYGGTEGLITMEDLLEEIVGEIRDESDVEPSRVEKRGDSWEADGGVMLDELESSGLEMGEHEGQTTIGGAVLGKLGRIPRLGDAVAIGGCRVEVIALARRRVVRVKITPLGPEAEPPHASRRPPALRPRWPGGANRPRARSTVPRPLTALEQGHTSTRASSPSIGAARQSPATRSRVMPSAERTATASLLHLAVDARGPAQVDAELPMPEDDEPFDPLADAEVRSERAHQHHDDDLGLRSLLEEPEAFTRSLWAWRRDSRH